MQACRVVMRRTPNFAHVLHGSAIGRGKTRLPSILRCITDSIIAAQVRTGSSALQAVQWWERMDCGLTMGNRSSPTDRFSSDRQGRGGVPAFCSRSDTAHPESPNSVVPPSLSAPTPAPKQSPLVHWCPLPTARRPSPDDTAAATEATHTH